MSSTDASAPTLVVYADYGCPFCYLGTIALDRLRRQREAPLSVEWRPFDLRRDEREGDHEIDPSTLDGQDEAYYEHVQANVDRLRETYDVDGMLDLAALPAVDSLHAQVASLAVRERRPDAWPAFDDAIYTALWESGRDIADETILGELATDCGIDPTIVRNATTDPDWRERVFEHVAEAVDRGVTGVPTFVCDGAVARGAVPPARLEELLDR